MTETEEINNKNSIDQSIIDCSEKIKEHKRQANFFLTFLLLLITMFILILTLLINKKEINDTKVKMFKSAVKNTIVSYKMHNQTQQLINENTNKTNRLIQLINSAQNKNDVDSLFMFLHTHDRIMRDFQQDLIDITYGIDTSLYTTRKLMREIISQNFESEDPPENKLYYFLYALFVLIFGVVTSFYRYHLKEISKLEQYFFGFKRIRIAGNNSSSGYDDLVKEALTINAFPLDLSKKEISSPLPGHPGSDISTNFINKLLDKFDLTPKKVDSKPL